MPLVTAVFATFLLLSLVLATGTAFSSPRSRPALKWLLIVALLVAWVALAFAVREIVSRTSVTLVTPGGARQPRLVEQAARQGLTLFLSLGAPALLVTLLAWLSLKATRPRAQ